MATIKDVSKLAGVSVATVSRFLNKSGYVSADAEKAIMDAVKKLNYQPNNIARSLAGKKTATIGLIIPDILNPFFPEIARAIEDAANKYNYTVMLCNTDNDPEKEKKYIETLVHKKVDGIIISSYTIEAEQVIALQNQSIPTIVIDKAFPDHSIVSLTSNNRKGGQLATQHLIDKGCSKIAHICGPTYITSAKDRSLGFEDIARERDWFVPSLMAYSDFTVNGGYQSMLELYKTHPDLDGVFAGNDIMAAGAYKALKQLGVSVPEEVKLIGFDGINLEMIYPEISTIAQPIYSIGNFAMDCLMKLINEEPVDINPNEFDVELLVKDTSSD